MPESKPQCLSLVVADSVRQEKNGKFILVGVYSIVKLNAKPPPSPISVFASVKGIPEGTHTLGVQVISLDAKKQMTATGQNFESAGADAIGQFSIEMADFEFPSSGPYLFRLLVDGEPVGEQGIVVEFPTEESSDKPKKARKRKATTPPQ